MDDEEEQAAALAAVLDSLRHMSRDDMKKVLLDGSNDPEYIATVDTLFARDDVTQEQLVEIFKETLFSNNAEASDAKPSSSSTSTKKKKPVYTSSEEEEEVVVRRPTKKRILPSSDESVDSNETVNLAKVKKKKAKTKEEANPAEVQKKVVETISIDSSSDSELDRRKYTKHKEKGAKQDVSKKPEAKKEGKSSKHEKESRKEHRVDKDPSRLKEESSRGREREKDKRDESKSAARADRKHSSSDRKDKTSKEEKRKEEIRKAEKRRDEERKREQEREEKRQKEREEKREKEREEKREKEREEKREKEREEKRLKEREEKRQKEREEKRQKEREEKREKEREEKRQKEREEKREKEREEKREKEREEKRQKEREEKREKEREKERKHSKEEASKRCDETKTHELEESDKHGDEKERHKSVSETDKDKRVKVDDQGLDTKLQTEARQQVQVDSVKVEEITEVKQTEGDTRTDYAKNDTSAVIDDVTFLGTAARSAENTDCKQALISGAGSTDAKIEPVVICDTSVKDISAPVSGSARKPSDAIPSSSVPQHDEYLLTKTGSFEAAISTEITKERALEPKDKIKIPEASRKEVSFPPDIKVRVPQVPLTDPDFKKYKKKFRLKRLKVVLYDVQKQKRDMQEGDKVHRAEERKRKKDRHKPPERKEKYSERGTRILPFEKRPENADIYGRKREIVREKPKTETPTEKQKRFAELHKKERENQEKKKSHLINTDFRIPKAGKKPKYNLVENIISSSTPLAPPVKVSKMHFDKRRMVTTTAKEDSWGLTPQEEAALKKLEKDAEKRKNKKDSSLIVLDDDMPDFGFQDQDDDNDLFPSTTRPAAAADQEDDADSVGYPPTDTPPPPIKECETNDLSMGVVRLLDTQTCIELADEHATHADVIMQKCGKWFRSVEHEPYYQACPSVPEQTEEEFYTLMEAMDEDEDDVSFIGNVSNPDGDDDLQDSEITSTAIDPDQLDEYCGAALLNAKLRVKPGDSPDCFRNILEVRRGCNYDKVNFQAKCLLCEEQITDKRSLGVHLRSSKHRTHLSETSLKLVDMSMKSKKSDSVSVPADSKTSSKMDSSRSDKDKEKEAGKEKQSKIPENKPKEMGKEIKEGALRREDVKRHRSRSRSPRRRSRSRGRRSRSRGRRSRSRSRGRRSRSRSPQRRRHRSRSRSYSPRGRHHHRRSNSPGRRRMSHVDESLGRSDRRRSRSPKAGVSLAQRFKETDNLIFHEKLNLVANGKWTTQLEGRWKLKEEEEKQLKKIFAKKRKNLEEKPEEHELYNPEWSKFWERRYQELLEENKDPDDYDYTPEWKIHWKGFSEGILDQEFATRMEEIRTKFGLDLSTLRALNVASAPPPVATTTQGHGPIPPLGHPVFNPLVPPSGMPGLPPMPIVPPLHVPIVGAPPLPVGPIPPTFPATMGYPAVAPPPVAPIVNAPVPPVHPVQAHALTSVSSTPLASNPARTVSAEPPLVGRHSMGEDYEAKPMSISSGSEISVKPEPAVTVDDVKNTWLNYTGQKMTAAVVAEAKSIASNASSGKSQAFDYDGLDVVQVLRIMLGLEDELSFLAIQVQNYYQKAEKLEAEKKRKSFGMLSEADFVNLLKQCRDKFYAILKANVSPSDVMKKLNLAVFALNALLESSACEKLRPAAPPPATVDLPKVSPKSPLQPVARELSRDSSLPPSRAMSNPIADALAHLPQNVLVEMSSIIATSLIAQGKDRLSDTELNSNLLNIFRPVLRHTVESPGKIDSQVSGQGSFSGLKSGTTEPRPRKSGGSVTEDEGFGMTSFLPRGGGGGGSWGRDGRNPIPEDQDEYDIRSTQENCSPFVNEPGPSKISKKLGNLEAKSSELKTPSSQLHSRNDDEPYDPENEYGKPTLSYERRKSVEFIPKTVEIAPKSVDLAPTPVVKVGPRLPAGIANLIQKEKTARTLGAAGVHSSTNLEFRRPERSVQRVDRLVHATSSISSISEIGEVKDSKRYRRKSKKLKAEADNKHKSEHRKKRRRHSQISPERSTKRGRDDRHPSRRHSDGMDRIPESRHAESHRKERHRGKEHRKRRSADGRVSEKSDEHQGNHSTRRRRSKTTKKHKRKESADAKVDGVSKHFWNESGSTISSEDNIPGSHSMKDTEDDEIQGRHVPAYRASNVVEEGELICTSEEDFSDSPRSQEKNKAVALQSEDIVSEDDSWEKAEG